MKDPDYFVKSASSVAAFLQKANGMIMIITIGNQIGSNISNISLVLGISGVISPISVTESTLHLTAPFMIFISLILLIFVATDWEIRGGKGVTPVTFYFAFMLHSFYLA